MNRHPTASIDRDEIDAYVRRARLERAKAIRAVARRLVGRSPKANG